MSYADHLFIKNCDNIIKNGISDEEFDVRPKWEDGTPAHTKKILYVQDRYQLTPTSIPVMTLRRTALKSCVDEILWIYQKKTSDISQLNSHIWDSWDVGDGTIGKAYGYQIGQKSKHHKYSSGSLSRYKNLPSAEEHDGWVYLDQMDAVLYDLKYNPASRSIMTNTYNHHDLADMGLRPCAYSMMFNVTKESGEMILNGTLFQRSQDTLTANNWNTVQYAVLLQMVAQVTGMKPGLFVHHIADMHIYDRHIPIVQELIDKYKILYNAGSAILGSIDEVVPYRNPEFWINKDVKSFYDFTKDDVAFKDYLYLPFDYKIPVAV